MDIYLNRNGQQVGPYPETEIVELMHRGIVLPTDLAWKEGMAEWITVQEMFGSGAATLPALPAPPPVIRSTPPGMSPEKVKSNNLLVGGVLGLLALCAISGVVYAVWSASTDQDPEPDPYANFEGEHVEDGIGMPNIPGRPNLPPEPLGNPQQEPLVELPDPEDVVAAPLLSPQADLPVPLAVRIYNRRLNVVPESADHPLQWIEFLGTNQVRFSHQPNLGTYTLTNQTAHLRFGTDNASTRYTLELAAGPHTNLLDTLTLNLEENEAPVSLLLEDISPAHWGTLQLGPPESVQVTLPFDPDQLRTRALAGEPEAQGWLAVCLRWGWGMRKDLPEAFQWARLAAGQGDLNGRYEMASHWGIPLVAPYDPELSKTMFQELIPDLEQAAVEGNEMAHFNLGYLHAKKIGPDPNEQAMFEHLVQSTATFPGSWLQIGLFLKSDSGFGPANPQLAETWFRMAAERGSNHALNELGLHTRKQAVNGPEYLEAARMYLAAAEAGVGQAQYNISVLLRNGHEDTSLLEPNPDEADLWLERSAGRNPKGRLEWAKHLLTRNTPDQPAQLIDPNTGQPSDGVQPPNSGIFRPSIHPGIRKLNPEQIPAAYKWARRAAVGNAKSVAPEARRLQSSLLTGMPLDTALQIETAERREQPFLDYSLAWIRPRPKERVSGWTDPTGPLWTPTYLLTSQKSASRFEIQKLATLQTNATGRNLLIVLHTLDQLAPERLNRRLSDERPFLLQSKLPGPANTRDKTIRMRADTQILMALAFLQDLDGYKNLRNDLHLSAPAITDRSARLAYARALLLLEPELTQGPDAKRMLNGGFLSKETKVLLALANHRLKNPQETEQMLNDLKSTLDLQLPAIPADESWVAKFDRERSYANESPFDQTLQFVVPYLLLQGLHEEQSGTPADAQANLKLARQHLDHMWKHAGMTVGRKFEDWIFCQILERELAGLLNESKSKPD